MKRINLTSLVLMVYLLVIAVMAWPGKKLNPNYTEYFCIMGATAVIIVILRIVQIKRLKMLEKRREAKK